MHCIRGTSLTPTCVAADHRHVDLPVSWPATAPAALIKGTEAYLTQQVLKLGAIAGSTGLPQAAYASEADYNEVEWQDVWYGRDNYR